MIQIITILAATLAALGFADYADWLNNILPLIPEWIQAFSLVVAGASALAALTETDKDNQFLVMFKSVLNALGFNFGAAKNLEDLEDKVDA